MHNVRKLGLATVFAASAMLAVFGCKRETLQTPNRDGTQAAHDHKKDFDNTLGAPGVTPEEVHLDLGRGGGPKDKSAPLGKSSASTR